MMEYSLALSLKLDARRELSHGQLATLDILDYARPGFRGYDSLMGVASGWQFRSGKEIGEPITLEIVESTTLTAEILGKATVFSVNGKIFKLVGEEGRKAPTDPSKPLWNFRILPTGEIFNP